MYRYSICRTIFNIYPLISQENSWSHWEAHHLTLFSYKWIYLSDKQSSKHRCAIKHRFVIKSHQFCTLNFQSKSPFRLHIRLFSRHSMRDPLPIMTHRFTVLLIIEFHFIDCAAGQIQFAGHTGIFWFCWGSSRIVYQDDEKRNESSETCYRAKAWKYQYAVNICNGNFTGNKARKVGHVGTMYYVYIHEKQFLSALFDKRNLSLFSFFSLSIFLISSYSLIENNYLVA